MSNGTVTKDVAVITCEDSGRDLSVLVVPGVGRLAATGDRCEPFRMDGPAETVVEPVTAFFRDLLAAGRASATVRSYGMDRVKSSHYAGYVGGPVSAFGRATTMSGGRA